MPLVVVPHDAGQCHDRDADGAEGDRGGVGDQADAGRVEGAKAEADQRGAGDGDRGAETRGPLDEGAEAEGNEKGLQAAVTGESG